MNIKSIAKNVGWSLLTVAGLAAAFHAGTQVAYEQRMNKINEKFSTVQEEFYKQHEVRLEGALNLVDDHWINFVLGKQIAIEKKMGDIPLERVVVKDTSYVKQSFFQQSNRWNGKNSSFASKTEMHLNPDANKTTIIHELAHVRTHQLLKKNPEFFYEWNELAKDENGNSMYVADVLSTRWSPLAHWSRLSEVEDKPLYAKPVSFWTSYFLNDVDSSNSQFMIKEVKGFISAYAMTNIFEDVAEVREKLSLPHADSDYDLAAQAPERIQKKIRLLEKYGFIEEGFVDFSLLKRQSEVMYAYFLYDKIPLEEEIEQFDLLARKFNQDYPNNQWISEIHGLKADLYKELAEYCEHHFFQQCEQPEKLYRRAMDEIDLEISNTMPSAAAIAGYYLDKIFLYGRLKDEEGLQEIRSLYSDLMEKPENYGIEAFSRWSLLF